MIPGVEAGLRPGSGGERHDRDGGERDQCYE